MGMKISPGVFSRLMTVAKVGLSYDACFVYLEDLLVFGHSLQNHINLVNVLDRLRQVNLKLNPRKCEFLKIDILYLGRVISEDDILPDQEETKVITQYLIQQRRRTL